MMEKVEFLCVHYNGEELAALNGMLGDMGDEEQAERIAAEVTRIKAEQDAKWVKSWRVCVCATWYNCFFVSALV